MYKNLSITSFVISVIFIGLGLHKRFVYANPENSYLTDPVNSYVGGDAYNFIINANYAIGYFVLALLFTIVGCTLLLIYKLNPISIDNQIKEEINSNSLESDV